MNLIQELRGHHDRSLADLMRHVQVGRMEIAAMREYIILLRSEMMGHVRKHFGRSPSIVSLRN